MVRDVIALPLRAGVLATRLGFRLAEQVIVLPLRVAGRLIEAVAAPPREGARAAEAPGDLQVAVVMVPPSARREESSVASASPASPTTQAAAAAPAHVSEDAELVESFAEPGAEDGAGAAVHVEEPWKGYRHMTANEIVARLAHASREELATVELYERLHRRRRTVLAAAERDLRRATAAASRAGR